METKRREKSFSISMFAPNAASEMLVDWLFVDSRSKIRIWVEFLGKV